MYRYAALAALIPLVAGHGFVIDPPPRRPGEAFKAACGEQPFYQQSSDINGNVQGIFQVVGSNFNAANCNLWLCKGFKLEDNPSNVQSYSLGQTIDFSVNIAAPHTGYANVSVVKTSSNTMIGEPLIEFSNYASNAGMAANNSAFSVTLPQSLGGECTEAGDCVLQWFWDAPNIDQTYEACVDFTVAGGSGSSGSRPTTTAAAAVSSTVDAVSVSVTSQAAATTSGSTTPTSTPGGDDEECPADEDDGEDDGEEECPADEDDDGTDDGTGAGDDDEECPADEDEDDVDEEDDTGSAPVTTTAAAVVTSAIRSRVGSATPRPSFTTIRRGN